ncbi:hypothetical protein [Frigidibacter sp. ROC022]|uniref:hypothetical protein n=1 Tax=Frigidibacter sp. ROC022 TaxID=2971796 RepID=UPI003FCCA819
MSRTALSILAGRFFWLAFFLLRHWAPAVWLVRRFSDDADQRIVCALGVASPQSLTVVETEVKFGKMSVPGSGVAGGAAGRGGTGADSRKV